MPGITGIIRTTASKSSAHDLSLMMEALRHETHYVGGEHTDDALGIYVGWMSHRDSFSDCGPLHSDDGMVTIVFQGEDYRDDVGADPRAHHILALYLQHGESALRELNGWYCGLIIDRRTQRTLLFNDRFGMGRVYYAEGPDEFLFASEAKALLRIRPGLRCLDRVAVAEYLRYECVPGEKSLFTGVHVLPRGAAWAFERNSATPKRGTYFRLEEWEAQTPLRAHEINPRFAETVSRVCARYVKGVGPVGLSLTAGLDTRAIVAAVPLHGDKFPCYTFGGSWGELFDIRVGRRLAEMHHQSFEAIRIEEAFLRSFPQYAERTIYVSDGTHDAFGAHDIYFNARARHIAPVRLTGKFGSEVVRIRRLTPSLTYESNLLNEDFRRDVFDKIPPFAEQTRDVHPLTRVVGQEIPWHEFGRLAIEQSQVTLRTPYMDNDLVKLMYQVPTAIRADGDLQDHYVRERRAELTRIPTNMGRFISTNRRLTRLLYLAFRVLFKVEYVYLFATPHWLTRLDTRLAAFHLERMLAGRQKWEGYRLWSRDVFGNYLRDVLTGSTVQYGAFFEPRVVAEMVTRHLAGTHNYLNSINRILSVELIHRTLLRS